MRICLFTPTFLPKVGGTEYVTDGLARWLAGAGHDVTVLAQGDAGGLDVPYRVEWFTKPLLPRWWPERTSRALRRLHKREPLDVVAVNYANPTGYGAVRFGERVGLPVVLISHGGDLYEGSRDRQRAHLWRRTEYAYRHADALVAISPYIERLIRRIVPEPAILERIPNGIDVAALTAPADRPRDLSDDGPFALCLGNLGPMKGFDDAIRAYARVVDRLGGLRLLLAGGGKLDEALREVAQSSGVADRVVFLGKRVGEDKRWLLQHCAFGVMPSIEEGHPIVALEFLAVGKPLICTTIGAFDGMYEHGVNGLRIEPRDVPALAEAMVSMADDANAAAMAEACAGRVAAYDWDEIGRRYLRLFERVVEARRGAAGRGQPAPDSPSA